jgi:hypothetical protein
MRLFLVLQLMFKSILLSIFLVWIPISRFFPQPVGEPPIIGFLIKFAGTIVVFVLLSWWVSAKKYKKYEEAPRPIFLGICLFLSVPIILFLGDQLSKYLCHSGWLNCWREDYGVLLFSWALVAVPLWYGAIAVDKMLYGHKKAAPAKFQGQTRKT